MTSVHGIPGLSPMPLYPPLRQNKKGHVPQDMYGVAHSVTVHLKVLLDGSLEGLGVGTDDLGDLLAVLEQDKGGHGADAEFLSDIGDLVDVNLVEAGVGVGVGEPTIRQC